MVDLVSASDEVIMASSSEVNCSRLYPLILVLK